MNRDLYEELKNIEFKPITFGLYNRIDDDMIPSYLGKKNHEIYGIDDFVYYSIPLDKKEKFLLSIHNKDIINSIKTLKSKIEGKDCLVDVDYKESRINVIKLINEELF